MATESTRLKNLLGGATAGKLERHRDVRTVGDLLRFWPRRYKSHDSDLSRLHEGEYVVVVARVRSATTRPMRARRGRMLTVTITDGDHDVDVTFFDARGHEGKLVAGTTAIFAGEVTRYRGRHQLAHPGYTVLAGPAGSGGSGEDLSERGLIPIYLQVKGLHNWTITECVRLVLGHLDELEDVVPERVRAARGLPGRLEAVTALHTPRDERDVARGRRRLRYEEAFVLQCLLARRRLDREREETLARPVSAGGLREEFDARLPFELTEGQARVGEVIAEEMSRTSPMHRLLQGEVGSGKTVVALRAMLAAVDAGGQAALLAPTEVLAVQHHRSVTAMLGDLAEGGMLGGSEVGTRVALLTGSMPTAARRRALLDVVSGEAGIVIGTHALIQDAVDFHDLALVVVDEQHRFGVEQRDALRGKAAHPPHVLVMTATPIPRTVAMTVFGDMETSTLRELPRGRQPITTHVVPEQAPGWVERTWQRVGEEVRGGRQAFVVCPRIGGDEEGAASGEDLPDLPEPDLPEPDVDGPDVADRDVDGPEVSEPGPGGEALLPPPAGGADRPTASVLEVHAELCAHPALAGLRIEVLHGRLAPEDKDAVMSRFAAGEVDVLVATTVIEVGVDVPNASVMVVRDAERFGVSQLHQLRGRVGRGSHPGLCLLMTSSDAPTARARLDAVAGSSDGFELARLDLTQRREGDVLGTRQSGGRSQLEFLSLVRDEELVAQAREDATEVVAADPDLTGRPALAAAVATWSEAEQAAYLEKG